MGYLNLGTFVVAVSVVGVVAAAHAGQAPSSSAVFTAAQADAGGVLYRANCAACHAGDLGGGGDAPRLAGEDFVGAWKERTTRELFQYVQGMPPGGPRLNDEEYLQVASYLLEQNGAQAGAQPLTEDTAVPIGTIATGVRPPR
jgi:mono/diheme cytochrome c family protein